MSIFLWVIFCPFRFQNAPFRRQTRLNLAPERCILGLLSLSAVALWLSSAPGAKNPRNHHQLSITTTTCHCGFPFPRRCLASGLGPFPAPNRPSLESEMCLFGFGLLSVFPWVSFRCTLWAILSNLSDLSVSKPSGKAKPRKST